MWIEKITYCVKKKICFSFHTIPYGITTLCVSRAYLRNGNYGLSSVVSLLWVFSQSGVSVFLSLLVFVTFSGGSGAAIHEKKSDWCFIESVCLLDLSDSIWCFLLHLYLSSYIAPPPNSITSDLAASQPLLIFKGVGAWNSDSEHRPDFHSLIFPSHFPLSP